MYSKLEIREDTGVDSKRSAFVYINPDGGRACSRIPFEFIYNNTLLLRSSVKLNRQLNKSSCILEVMVPWHIGHVLGRLSQK